MDTRGLRLVVRTASSQARNLYHATASSVRITHVPASNHVTYFKYSGNAFAAYYVQFRIKLGL
jgi:hypothetical protein